MIHVAMAFDDDLQTNWFLMICVDSIRRTTDDSVFFHFLVDPKHVRADFLTLVQRLISKSGHVCELCDIRMPMAKFAVNKEKWNYIPPVAIARLLIPEVVRCDGRVAYLDADIVVKRDLSQFVNEDLRGKPIGAVIDTGLVLPADCDDQRQIENLAEVRRSFGTTSTDPRTPIYSAGQFVIDIGALETRDWLSRSCERAARKLEAAGVTKYNDYSLFNHATEGSVAALGPKYFVSAAYLSCRSDAELDALRANYGVDHRDIGRVNRIHGTSYRSLSELTTEDAVIYHYNTDKARVFSSRTVTGRALVERYKNAVKYAYA